MKNAREIGMEKYVSKIEKLLKTNFTKSKPKLNKKEKTAKKTTSKKTATKHDLLYIMSPQCGWCKKADPVVAELVKDGVKITTVDITTPEGQARATEVKNKYNAQCGTPLFLDAETGNIKCGFAEKDAESFYFYYLFILFNFI